MTKLKLACVDLDTETPHYAARTATSDICRRYRSDFLNSSWSEIKRLIADKRLVFLRPPNSFIEYRAKTGKDVIPPWLFRKTCESFYQRDQARLQEAQDVETVALPAHTHPNMAEILLTDTHIYTNSEIISLLFYLRERLSYRWGAYHMKHAPITSFCYL